MSSRNTKLHETLCMHAPPKADEDDHDKPIRWQPDWSECCEVCGQTPCVGTYSAGTVVMDVSRCAECLGSGETARVAVGSDYRRGVKR